VTHNFIYDTALDGAQTPYGTKGFIVMRKGGDAAVLKEGQAKASGWPNPIAYQNGVGMMPGDAEGTVGAEPATVLTFP